MIYYVPLCGRFIGKAEAMNELNGPSEEAIEWVNQIRRPRANATEIKLVDFNKDTFRDFILDRQGHELYCEGHRRDDLIRHGKYMPVRMGWIRIIIFYSDSTRSLE
ncbi:MAG: RagB/SusD family nutrient uptake outer membrane protein [Phocaeicola vulgatus]